MVGAVNPRRTAARRRRVRELPAAMGPVGLPTLDLLPCGRRSPGSSSADGPFTVDGHDRWPRNRHFIAGNIARRHRQPSAAGCAPAASAAIDQPARGRHAARVKRGRLPQCFQLPPLRRLLRRRLRRLPAARAPRPEPVAAGGELLLLRRVGLALHEPPRGVDGGQLRRRPGPRSTRRAIRSPPGEAHPRCRARLQPRRPRLLQVRRLLRRLGGAGADVDRLRHRRPALAIILPLGISFYTFMAMAYVIDVYRGDLRRSAASSTTRCSSPTSRTSSPGRSCGRRR